MTFARFFQMNLGIGEGWGVKHGNQWNVISIFTREKIQECRIEDELQASISNVSIQYTYLMSNIHKTQEFFTNINKPLNKFLQKWLIGSSYISRNSGKVNTWEKELGRKRVIHETIWAMHGRTYCLWQYVYQEFVFTSVYKWSSYLCSDSL